MKQQSKEKLSQFRPCTQQNAMSAPLLNAWTNSMTVPLLQVLQIAGGDSVHRLPEMDPEVKQVKRRKVCSARWPRFPTSSHNLASWKMRIKALLMVEVRIGHQSSVERLQRLQCAVTWSLGNCISRSTACSMKKKEATITWKSPQHANVTPIILLFDEHV